MNLKPAQSSELEKFLKTGFSGEVFLDEYQRSLYSTDASIYQIMPAGVVVPRSSSDVVRAVQAAAERASRASRLDLD